MHWKRSLLCGGVWLVLLCFVLVYPSPSKCQIGQRARSKKTFCDPSFSNQTGGAATQKCDPGFYREWTRPHRGQCVPCSCNGLSTECDERTGNCVNCQFNTTGDRCERCKEGYYGNAANRTCRVCPCPFTWNNFAVACLDTGSGEVECLCKRGYSGTRCERCAHGYYGNPVAPRGSCKPCNWKDGTLNNCGSLTGDCDSCIYALLVDFEEMDDGLSWLKQQLQNISLGLGSHSVLSNLEANITETKILVGNYSTAVRHLDPKVEQLEVVNVVRDDMSQLIDETLRAESELEKVLQNVRADDLLSEVESLLTTIPDLIKQLSEGKLGGSIALSENHKVRMMEEAQRIVQEMRERGCTAQTDKAGKLLNLIQDNMSIPVETLQAVPSQTADSLMASLSSLRELAALQSQAEDRVDRTQGLNLKSYTTLQHLQHLQTQIEKEQNTLLPVTEMTKDLLNNITDLFLMLEEIKKEFEIHTAHIDGARPELLKKFTNIFQSMTKVDIVTKAEEHAEQLKRAATEFQQELHNATNSTGLLSVQGIGAYNCLINAIEKAEMAANQSREDADQAIKDVKKGGLVNKAEGLRDNSTQLQTEASNTQSDLKMLSHTVKTHKDRVKKQKEKRGALRTGISTIRDDLKTIKRDEEVLIDSAKTAASASSSTVRNITERLKNIRQEVEGIILPIVNENMDMMIKVEEALRNLNSALPVMTDNLTQVEALSRQTLPSANMTESIERIKELIEETRNFVNRLSTATTFNGKGHIELRPPRNLEDIKAFTAVDLLLNLHQNNTFKTDHRRKRRQDKDKNAHFFIFYLGNKDASGDYIGMAIRRNVLICVYKLGGVVHEVVTSHITTTTKVTSSDFDRVVFHRVYQDAQVNITQSFTSQTPGRLFLYHNLSNTMTGVLDLDPDSVVVYVGGYPENFTPPVELRYPRYRGAMKLSFINDSPVCLFNYKHAVNMDAKQPYIKIPQSDACNYYDGTGYLMAFVREPDKKQKRQFRFYTTTREADTLLFYMGNEESLFYVFLERGFLVLQDQQAGQELRVQSSEKMSLNDTLFIVRTGSQNTNITVCYEQNKIIIDQIHTNYMSYYIGGLPAQLKQRHNITAPPLRGCVDILTENQETTEYNRMIGVSKGCPVSILGVRAATLYSALSIDSLLVWEEEPVRVSLGFRTTDKHGALLRSRSQGSTSGHDLQLALSDGYVVLNSNNYTLKSDKQYSDGNWHYLIAVRRSTGLELSIDNVNVIQGQSHHIKPVDQNSRGQKFKGCITNLYSRRPGQSFIPADLSSFSQTGDVALGLCSLHSPPHTKQEKHGKHKPVSTIHVPTGSHCRRAHRGEYQLYDEHSWLSYTVPQEDLNYRPHFSLDIKTKSSNGLILHLAGRGVVPLLALYMASGKIKMSLGQNRIIQHKQKSNDGNWHRVEFSVERSTFHLLVDGIRVTDGQLPNNEGSSLDNPVYLGADPKSRTIKGHNIPMNTVTGCIRDFKVNDVAVGEPEANHKTLPCLDGLTETGTYFGGGHIILGNFTVGSHFVLSFELRPQYLTGLLFHVPSDKTSFNVFLMENKVSVKVNDGNDAVSVSVTPHESLCDGKFHTVTVSKKPEMIRLVVDSVSEQKAVLFTSISHSTTLNSLSIGGTTNYRQVPVSSPFVGCLRNVKVNGGPLAFKTESRVVDPVSIDRCPKE